MYDFLRKIKAYFQTVEIYYNKTTFRAQLDEKYKISIYKSLDQVKDKKILEYFDYYKNKKKGLKKTILYCDVFRRKIIIKWLGI